jgi:hypothetical protein
MLSVAPNQSLSHPGLAGNRRPIASTLRCWQACLCFVAAIIFRFLTINFFAFAQIRLKKA